VSIQHGGINGAGTKTFLMEEKDRQTLTSLRANAKNKDFTTH